MSVNLCLHVNACQTNDLSSPQQAAAWSVRATTPQSVSKLLTLTGYIHESRPEVITKPANAAW